MHISNIIGEGILGMVLDHVAIIVSKEENLQFYEKLGFQRKFIRERPYDKVVFMECDGIFLEVFVDPNHPNRASKPEAIGLRHIALSVDDFDMVCEKFDIDKVTNDFFGKRFALIKDLDGQPIEIKER